MPTTLPPDVEAQAINVIRGFAMDAPLRAKSGHQGTAMALAPLANVLYSRILKHDPDDPEWPDRDRFILSNGHASILQYSMLYLSGYGLQLADIEAFRSYDSRTPGHPEARHTPGIEVTTGPLGQGFGDAVGMAIAERVLRERFGSQLDRPPHLRDRRRRLLHGGRQPRGRVARRPPRARPPDLRLRRQPGHDRRQHRAVLLRRRRRSLRGLRLERRSYLGEIGDDCDALEAALLEAKADDSRPHLLVLRSHIGTPSPDHTDDPAAHGNPFTPEDVTRTKAVMGIPDEPFWAPEEVVATLPRHRPPAGPGRQGARGPRRSTPSTATSGRRGTRPGTAPA